MLALRLARATRSSALSAVASGAACSARYTTLARAASAAARAGARPSVAPLTARARVAAIAAAARGPMSTVSSPRRAEPHTQPTSTVSGPGAAAVPAASVAAQSASAPVSGAPAEVGTNWVDRYFPQWFGPYARLSRWDRPIGTWLLLWPCLWSTAAAMDLSGPVLASGGPVHAMAAATMFGVGAFVMRGAGCTVNDLWDRDFDKRVARTANRPLASGQVTPKQAVAWCAVQCVAGLAVVLTFNLPTIGLAFLSVPIAVVYPVMKRFTFWPQLVLGAAFNWGALLGHSALHAGAFGGAVALPLYGAGICWTLVYDTIYAHQDTADDKQIGVKSTALLFAHNTTRVLSAFAAGTVGCLALAGAGMGAGPAYYAVACAGSAAHFAWQLRTARYDDRANCNERFLSNRWIGAMVCGGIVLDQIHRRITRPRPTASASASKPKPKPTAAPSASAKPSVSAAVVKS